MCHVMFWKINNLIKYKPTTFRILWRGCLAVIQTSKQGLYRLSPALAYYNMADTFQGNFIFWLESPFKRRLQTLEALWRVITSNNPLQRSNFIPEATRLRENLSILVAFKTFSLSPGTSCASEEDEVTASLYLLASFEVGHTYVLRGLSSSCEQERRVCL